jgi:transposase-like protein
MAVPYPENFKKALVKRMTGPAQESAAALSDETGVHQTTLSRWVREAAERSSFGDMTKTRIRRRKSSKATGATNARRPQDFSPEEKFQVLMEVAALKDEELGAYLRRKGIHEAQLQQWRQAVNEALDKPAARPRVSPEQKAQKKRIQQLERELTRKDKALAETAALLVLKKKAQAIWGDGDDDMSGRNG